MLYHRSSIIVQRGFQNFSTTYDEPFDTPVIELAPYEHLVVDYYVYYHVFLVPLFGRPDIAEGKVLYIKNTTPNLVAIQLRSNDWRNENFEEGDEIYVYSVTSLTSGAGIFGAIYGKINSIRGATMVVSTYTGGIVNPLTLQLSNYFLVFLIEPERRGRPGVLPASFQTIFRRFGDVDGDVSPLSGLRYAEPHADGFLVELDSHSILPYDPNEIPFTGYARTQGIDVSREAADFLTTWSAVPVEKRSATAFRLARRRIRLANFFSYRQEYNTLARAAQRDLYHENADLITRLVLNSDEREIKLPLRLRLMHANVNQEGVALTNEVPTISQGAGIVTTFLPITAVPAGHFVWRAAFALTTDNNEHHLSTLIRHQHDLTRFTNVGYAFTPGVGFTATLPITTLANDLRRNPFETYVVALWRMENVSTGEDFILCSDAVPLDIDENIAKVIFWQNDSSLKYHYHRFNDAVLVWQENTEPERGEYQVYIRIRRDANSPAYTAQQYTYKVDESTRIAQTATLEEFYALHYAHEYQLFPPHIFTTGNADVTIRRVNPTQNDVIFRVPPPSFDFPSVRNPNIRPRSGALFHWFEAIGCPIFNITSGSPFYAQPIRVSDGEMRIYVITPSGKIYATPWRQVRAQEPTDLNFNVHWISFTENANFVTVLFPSTPNPPAVIKSNVKLFQDYINTLKPVAEAAYDNSSGGKTTDINKILPLFGFFGSRVFILFKQNLPPGRYKIHAIASYSDDAANTDAGFEGYVDDADYTFTVGTPIEEQTPIPRQECCYNPPVIAGENIKYIVFNDANNTYNQQSITIPANPTGTAWQNFVDAYGCCFKIYNNNAILRENFVDVIALFDNRINNIPISGEHWFRYRGFIQSDGYEITEESYVRSDLSEEPVLRTYRKKYILELFLTDCDIKQLDFQKLARRWRIRNYTNSLLPDTLEVLVKNIEQTPEYNKLKVTVSLVDYKPDEYRHK